MFSFLDVCACLIIHIYSYTHYYVNIYVIALATEPRSRSSVRRAAVVRLHVTVSAATSNNIGAYVTVTQPMDTGTNAVLFTNWFRFIRFMRFSEHYKPHVDC